MSASLGPRSRRIAERELVFLLGAISATTALGIDMALPAFGDIRLGLGLAADSPRVALTVTLYFFGMAGAQMFYGPFTDRFGRKPVLYAGLALYTLGALGSALAPSFGALIASRLVWGIGAAGPRALSLAIGRDLYEGDRLGPGAVSGDGGVHGGARHRAPAGSGGASARHVALGDGCPDGAHGGAGAVDHPAARVAAV